MADISKYISKTHVHFDEEDLPPRLPPGIEFEFCPTGEGGGKDPTCSPDGANASVGPTEEDWGMLDETYADFVESKATKYELNAIKYYVEDPGSFNDTLRGGYEPTSDIKDLDTAIDNAPRLPKDVVVARGMPPGILTDLKVGDLFVDKAFLSTTANHETAEVFANPDEDDYDVEGLGTIMNIRVPAGHKGLYIGKVSEAEDEAEFILPRGTKIRVEAMEETKYARVITARVEE